MRYENPLYMAEEAAAADLISGGRLQLGISRGSPEPALHGSQAFGYVPAEGESDADLARRKTELFRAAIAGAARRARRSGDGPGAGMLADPAAVARARRPHLVGLRNAGDRRLGGRAGHEPDELDAPARGHRRAVRRAAGRADRDLPRGVGARRAANASRASRSAAASSRSPPTSTAQLFGGRRRTHDQVGYLDGAMARFGKSYTGEPDVIAAELAQDAAVRPPTRVLLTVPEPARRRLQRAPARHDRRARRTRDRLGAHRRANGLTSLVTRDRERRAGSAEDLARSIRSIERRELADVVILDRQARGPSRRPAYRLRTTSSSPQHLANSDSAVNLEG